MLVQLDFFIFACLFLVNMLCLVAEKTLKSLHHKGSEK